MQVPPQQPGLRGYLELVELRLSYKETMPRTADRLEKMSALFMLVLVSVNGPVALWLRQSRMVALPLPMVSIECNLTMS